LGFSFFEAFYIIQPMNRQQVFHFFATIGRPFYYTVAFGWVGYLTLRLKIEQLLKPSLKPLLSSLHSRFSVPKKTSHSSLSLIKVALNAIWLLVVFLKNVIGYLVTSIVTPFWLIERTITLPFRLLPQRPLVRFLAVLSVFLWLLCGASWWTYEYIFRDLPAPTDLDKKNQILTTKIYDRRGEVLYSIYKDENRRLIKLADLPPEVIMSTLAIEDANFYNHAGFSVKGILRAIKINLTKDKIQGGSTITQQLVKNTLLTSEKKFRRKVRELFLAIAVDATYEKDQILEMYFNQIPYGGSTYGIEEAAEKYFGKHAKELSLAEAALLAGIPASPTAYSPFGTNPELAIARQHEVLSRMVKEGYITPEQAQQAMAEPLKFVENKTKIEAPHFVMYVRSLLAKQFGEEMVSQGGLEVYTTLDLELQNQVQDIVANEVNDIRKFRISNGAALVTRPDDGEILAMVGSIDYFDFKNDGQVNLTTRLRQPGSSIKPLTYAIALENGYTPSTTISDEPITFQIPGSPPYSPKNYDGKFHGNVTVRQSLANSYNIPAVKTLNAIGINRMIDKAQEMGITSWQDRSRFGLSLTLGGGEVYMTELAQVYGTFANNGYTVPLNPLLLVKDSHGNILYENPCIKDVSKCPRKRTLDPRVAYQINDILSDNNARSAAFGPNSVLHIPGQQVAVKTGTTNNLKDNWTIGYTKDRLVATWVGNNDGTPMSYVASGITGASPMWNKIIRTQLDADSPHVFKEPADLKKVAICVKTGTLPCASCPQIKEEYFIPGTEPQRACTPEHFKQNDQVSRTDARPFQN
jgi:1A family penicillin-binding protein